ncbi:hypothetical protein Fmac_026332 [Flemingia macrophylla]|uniref:C2 domain-containing protein n=1 Tax=Flemingia macrophylla TaxID=520843 RepID=A0ABD1LEU2_9FABA
MHSVVPQVHPSNQDEVYNLRETDPQLGERWPNSRRGWMNGGERFSSTHDLVEQMFYLYVRVVKAKDLPPSTLTSSCDPYVEVKLGNYKGRTKHIEKKTNPEWNRVEPNKDMVGRDDYIGRVAFDLNEVPTRVPPDSPLAPQWYRLDDRRGERKVRGDIMLAILMGTQADEAFSKAWHFDAATVYGEGVFNVRSKVYVSPKLWTTTPLWNEDLVFVAAEPFEEMLTITVEDRVHPSKDEVLGKINLPLTVFEKRLDHRPVHSLC